MEQPIVNVLAAMTMALLTAFALPAPAVAQDQCLSKQEIQQKLSDGEIAPLADVMERAGLQERPLSVQVCDVDGSPHYIVNMINSNGESQSITLNARDG